MSTKIIFMNRLRYLPRLLIEARKDQGITYRQLADRLGLKWQQVHRWEKQKYEHIGFDNLLAVAKALKIGITMCGVYG